jgi:hypothetical protein
MAGRAVTVSATTTLNIAILFLMLVFLQSEDDICAGSKRMGR